ncbi:MAG: ribonuclease PH [Dehalococcoidia bacterium]|nr:ribonuclease PH [Dehalococcoidia bacterium]MSQ34388.1 ribonuclease PH [Dehalococcoidia bacterium]
MTVTRTDGRRPDQPRPVRITPGYLPNAEGSALIEIGDTHVICAASVGMGVPSWMKGQGRGWVTAEYAMLPRSTSERTPREGRDNRGAGGRTQEIQRLVGRSLRAVTDTAAMGEVTVTVDCDVLRADGGTRTASITGAYIALHIALRKLQAAGKIKSFPLTSAVAATSVGIVAGVEMLDLAYSEDSRAETDLNVVMTGGLDYVEVQGTAEGKPFSKEQLDRLLGMARSGIKDLLAAQAAVLERAL